MRPIFLLSALLLLALPLPCLSQDSDTSTTRMGNGLTVILKEDHAAELVGVDVWVRAGTGSETPENNGVAHFIEHLAFGATTKRKAGEVDREMESLGATLDARTSWDWAHFSTTVSSRYLAKALDVIADCVTHAQFREEDLVQERMVILEEIARKATDPISVCKDSLARELYGSHPYGMPVEGTEKSIGSISRDDILSYYRKHYVPANIAVVLVGDFDKQQAVAAVGQAFQGLSASVAPQLPTRDVSPPAKQITKSIKAALKSTYVGIGFVGPRASDYQDVCATDVLMAYLGEGARSWLMDELKAKMGLADDADTHFLTQREPAMLALIVTTTTDRAATARDAVAARLQSIAKEGIPDWGIGLAKRSVLGQYAFQNETYVGRANSYGFYYAISDAEFATKYLACVQSVTNADVMRVAQKYMDPQHAVIVTVGPNQGGAQ